jgi:hypothetical protein
MKALSMQIGAALVFVVFAVPITFFPIKWARAIGWRIPDDLQLARYFGRCLGVVILALVAFAVYASLHPPLLPAALSLTALVMLGMVPVHVVGWLEKAQPPLETAEIFLYAAAGSYFAWLALS